MRAKRKKVKKKCTCKSKSAPTHNSSDAPPSGIEMDLAVLAEGLSKNISSQAVLLRALVKKGVLTNQDIWDAKSELSALEEMWALLGYLTKHFYRSSFVAAIKDIESIPVRPREEGSLPVQVMFKIKNQGLLEVNLTVELSPHGVVRTFTGVDTPGNVSELLCTVDVQYDITVPIAHISVLTAFAMGDLSASNPDGLLAFLNRLKFREFVEGRGANRTSRKYDQ